MTGPVFKCRMETETRTAFIPCVACGEIASVDDATGLCRHCWRVATLGSCPRCEHCRFKLEA